MSQNYARLARQLQAAKLIDVTSRALTEALDYVKANGLQQESIDALAQVGMCTISIPTQTGDGKKIALPWFCANKMNSLASLFALARQEDSLEELGLVPVSFEISTKQVATLGLAIKGSTVLPSDILGAFTES